MTTPRTNPRTNCECEHLSHFNSRVTTPGGEEGHTYWAKYDRQELKPVKTDYGTFHVCARCSQDCMKGEPPK